MVVSQVTPPRRPTTTRGTTSTESPGSSAKAKVPKQTRPVPGSPTSSRTTARLVVSVHHLSASAKRVVPRVRSSAATPQPTMPSPRRSQATGLVERGGRREGRRRAGRGRPCGRRVARPPLTSRGAVGAGGRRLDTGHRTRRVAGHRTTSRATVSASPRRSGRADLRAQVSRPRRDVRRLVLTMRPYVASARRWRARPPTGGTDRRRSPASVIGLGPPDTPPRRAQRRGRRPLRVGSRDEAVARRGQRRGPTPRRVARPVPRSRQRTSSAKYGVAGASDVLATAWPVDRATTTSKEATRRPAHRRSRRWIARRGCRQRGR